MTCTAPSLAVEVLGEDAFPSIAPEWESLLDRSYDNRIFLTPTWHRLWWDHFGSGEAHLVTCRDEQAALTGILPLMIRDDAGERVLTLTGSPDVMDYIDGAAVKDSANEILRSLWRLALDELRWDRLELRHVPSASPLIPALHDVTGDDGFSVQDDEVCPVAILCSSWDGYLQMLSKKQRHEIRRKLRRAQEGVEWSWRTARSEQDLERDLPVFFRLHELSAREKARFMTPDMRTFFESMARVFLRDGVLRLSIFTREGVDIAASLSFLYRERYLLYNSGYDPGYAAHSPGIAAVAHAMQDAIEDKAVAFDFLSGDEPYKYQFGATNTHTCRVDVGPG